MASVKGTPAYWKKVSGETIGITNSFMTLSCTDLRWDKLISIIATWHGKELSNEEIHNMDFFTRCSYLNLYSVMLAIHFLYRVEQLFKIIALMAHCIG